MEKTTSKKQEKTRQQQEIEQNQRILDNLKKIRHKLVVMSGKGGVGKSTVAVNLAVALANSGKEVGIMDLDIHGPNIPKMLGIENLQISSTTAGIVPVMARKNLKAMSMAFLLDSPKKAVIWRGPMKIGLIRQFLSDVNWGELDYLIVDLPPGTGDEPLSIAQNIPVGSHAIIVTTPQEVSILDVGKSLDFARQLNMKIVGIVENMSGFACPHCGENIDLFGKGGGEILAAREGVPFLGSIPLDPAIAVSGDTGSGFMANQVDSVGGKAFLEVVTNIRDFLGDAGTGSE